MILHRSIPLICHKVAFLHTINLQLPEVYGPDLR